MDQQLYGPPMGEQPTTNQPTTNQPVNNQPMNNQPMNNQPMNNQPDHRYGNIPNVFVHCNARDARSYVNVIVNGMQYVIHGGEQAGIYVPQGMVRFRFETRYRSGMALGSSNRGYNRDISVIDNHPTHIEVRLTAARNEIIVTS